MLFWRETKSMVKLFVKLCPFSRYHKESAETGGGSPPHQPPELPGDVYDDLPDPEAPRPSSSTTGGNSGGQTGNPPYTSPLEGVLQ